MDTTIPSAFAAIFLEFRPLFTKGSFENFVTLVTGWILCVGRHTISRFIQFGSGPGRKKHHSALYRFLSRAKWDPDALGATLVALVLPLIPGLTIQAIVDDTLCPKSGPHLWGAAMHYDAARSTYGLGSTAGRLLRFAFGHNWVIVSLWVPFPWNPSRGIAIPVLFRLYRSKKRCPAKEYKKRSLLAAEMLDLLASWLPEGTKLEVVGDREYACKTVAENLPDGAILTGPMPMNAAFYEVPGPYPGRGRPCKKGERLPSPKQLAEDDSIPWRSETLAIYGRDVEVLVKSQVGLWYHVTETSPVRMIVTRDPKGRLEDRAYFRTDPDSTTQQIAGGISRRWTAEVMHRDAKQHLGLADPRNGWWRRRHGSPLPNKKAGPQPDPVRGKNAVVRTVPIGFVVYAVVVLWYFKHGLPESDVERIRSLAPWYRHKQEPSFADMLCAARRELWTARLFSKPSLRLVSKKVIEFLPLWLLAG